MIISPKLGIDQSCKSFDACLLCGGKNHRRKFSNDEDGFRALTEWLLGLGFQDVHVSLESTGRYGNKLAQYMVRRGNKVSVVNPKRVTHHRLAMGIRSKTDSNDAYVNANYALTHEPGPWSPPSQTMLELRDIVGQLELVKKHRAALKNRLQCGLESRYVSDKCAALIEHLDSEIDELEAKAMQLVQGEEKLNRHYVILLSVPGIGPVIALSLVAQIDFSQFRTGRDLAAFLGLSPTKNQSGTTLNRSRISNEGDTRLRALLKQGATSAKRGKFYKSFVDRLTARGKRKRTVTNAVARKMLLIAHACLRRDELFRADYVHPLAIAT